MFNRIVFKRLIREELTNKVDEFCRLNDISYKFSSEYLGEDGIFYRLWIFRFPKACNEHLIKYLAKEIRKIEKGEAQKG